MTRQNLIGAMAEAHGTFEGFYAKKDTPARRNNNPGNLRSWGVNPVVGGYAKFSTVEDGWKALDAQISKNIDRGLTLFEHIAGQRDAAGEVVPGGYPGFAPAKDNNRPLGYCAFISSFIKKHYGWNVPVDKKLQDLIKG